MTIEKLLVAYYDRLALRMFKIVIDKHGIQIQIEQDGNFAYIDLENYEVKEIADTLIEYYKNETE